MCELAAADGALAGGFLIYPQATLQAEASEYVPVPWWSVGRLPPYMNRRCTITL